MPKLTPPVQYTIEITHFQRVLRTCQRDSRIPIDQFNRLRDCIDQITRILSEAQTK